MEDMELLCVIFWRVWCCRNEWLHKKITFDVYEAVWWSKNYLDELSRAAGRKVKDTRVEDSSRFQIRVDSWKPPMPGVLKINCGVRIDKRRRKIGYGFIVRNEEGRVQWCGMQGCEALYDLDCAKIMAIYKGIKVGIDLKLANFEVESDAHTIVKQIGRDEPLDASYGGILGAIQRTRTNVRNFSVLHVNTKVNKAAQALALEALNITNEVHWKEDAPLIIRDLVLADQNF